MHQHGEYATAQNASYIYTRMPQREVSLKRLRGGRATSSPRIRQVCLRVLPVSSTGSCQPLQLEALRPRPSRCAFHHAFTPFWASRRSWRAPPWTPGMWRCAADSARARSAQRAQLHDRAGYDQAHRAPLLKTNHRQCDAGVRSLMLRRVAPRAPGTTMLRPKSDGHASVASEAELEVEVGCIAANFASQHGRSRPRRIYHPLNRCSQLLLV
jgi:hypothetical protein